jgi:hypothetical protein
VGQVHGDQRRVLQEQGFGVISTLGLEQASARAGRLLGAFLIALLFAGFAATPAGSAPGAYRVIIVHATCSPPTELQADIAAFPDVAVVDFFDGCAGTPTAAQLLAYDLVVSMSNAEYMDQVGYGNALADFVDAGGVVVQFAYDNWDRDAFEGHNGPTGRFLVGGYEPFLPGDNPNSSVTLGSFDASSPLMQGVTALASRFNTEPTLAPDATLVARWSDGRNLIAQKGRVVSVSAYLDDAEEWSGDFGRLVLNAIRTFVPPTLTVENPTPGGGAATSSPAGLTCGIGGFTCKARFPWGTSVTVTAPPTKGFAFSGFGRACSGPACTLTMDAAKTVHVNFIRFAPIGKVRRNEKKGTALLVVRVGGPGEVIASGKRVKRKEKNPAAAANLKIPIVAKGRAAEKLEENGRVKVGVKISFTPTGGTLTRFSKRILLLLNDR